MTESATATIDAIALHELTDSGKNVRIVDVRTPGEFESAHIPGAYNVPLDLLREHRDEFLAHLDESIVLVCRSGNRATQAEETLRAAGLFNVHILDGGMLDWEDAGLPVNRGTQRWDLERQVRLVAGSLVLSSILASVAAPKLKWLAAGIGGGLTFAAVSNTCAMGAVLSKLPYNRSASCNPATIVAHLTESANTTDGRRA
ncbi:MAG: rhodanese-like domain-containing protein [Rhodococcus sp. (in: high G+C Gram-positive bacteria)]|uniref:rhodanese-like domain-containing protein n=1 Tax=Rhodococcus sp. TaxID=1831 RepID=UPI003BB4BF29